MKAIPAFVLSLASAAALGQALSLSDPARLFYAASTSACATTDTSLSHDEFLEGFQTATTGYNDGNAWTYTTSGTGTITPAADSSSLTSGKPDGACDQAWKVVNPLTGSETFARADKGSWIDISSSGAVFAWYVWVDGADFPDAGETYYILCADNTTTPQASSLFLTGLANNSGVLQLRSYGVDQTSWVSIQSNTWNKVEVRLDASGSAAGSSMIVNGGTTNTFQRNSATNTFRYIDFGSPAGLQANENGTLYFDVIAVNTP